MRRRLRSSDATTVSCAEDGVRLMDDEPDSAAPDSTTSDATDVGGEGGGFSSP